MKDIIRMNQLAGIITEGQARKMMEVLDEEDNKSNYYSFWNKNYSQIIKDLDLPPSYKVIDWPDLPKNIQDDIKKYIDKNS
jgi:hypothetical protein